MKTLEDLQRQQGISQDLRTIHEQRWARARKLSKGIFRGGATKSKVRNVEKIFFRKIWTTIWRLVASMYQTFLKDPDTFRIEGRDTRNDPHKASVLQKNVEFRRDEMLNKKDMFIKFIWAFWDIFQNGVGFGKFTWIYREDKEGNVIEDRPDYIAYPPEQVSPDLSVVSQSDMQYCHFLNYMTEEQVKAYGIENCDDFEATTVDSNQVRQTRYLEGPDPLGQNPSQGNHYQTSSQNAGGEYAGAGKYEDGTTGEDSRSQIYKIYESFWIEDGVMQMGIHSNFQDWAKKGGKEIKGVSPYGDEIPLVMGLCLTEPHQLIGEGFPEPLEGPQESFNYNLNMRKDGISAALAGMTIVDSSGGVNIESLVKRRKLGIITADNVNAIKHEQIPDVTQSSYMESEADSAMMDEMSGVTPGLRGMEETDKATVAQINYSESNAKIDLYSAIVGQTFMKRWHLTLAKLVQKFETDETVMRIANDKYREEEEVVTEDVYDYGFDIDCIMNVGTASGRETEVKQTTFAMDRSLQYMQALPALLQFGAIPKDGLKIPNISAFLEDLLPVIGKKNLKRYLITLNPPQQPQEGAKGTGSAPAPSNAQNTTNMMQEGAFGGM